MPRGHRRGNRHTKPKEVEGEEQLDARGERTVLFSKTKMCKFFILGSCTKGPECKFAHHRDELNPLPDLSRTKICKTLIATGICEDPDCRFAHNRGELRAMPAASLLPERGEPEDAASPLPPVPEAFAAMAAAAAALGLVTPEGQPTGKLPAWPDMASLPLEQVTALHQWLNSMAAQAAALQWALQASPGAPGAAGQTAVAGPSLASPPGGAGGVCWAPAVEEAEVRSTDATRDGQVSPGKLLQRLVVKNTFLDLESGGTPQVCPRSHTWAGGLCALAEEDLGDDAESLVDSSPKMLEQMADNTWRVQGAAPGLGDWGQLCVPEPQRNGFGRQASTSSDTSTAAPSEKRVQDTPLQVAAGASVRSSSSRSNLTTLCEEEADGYADLHEPRSVTVMRPERSSFPLDYHPTPDLSSLFNRVDIGGVIVKNTFLEFDTPSTPVAGLRSVHTASGRLDMMGLAL